ILDGDSDCDSGYGSVTPPVETTPRDSFVIPTIKITPLTNDEVILHNACVRASHALRNMFIQPYSTNSPAYTSPYTNDNNSPYCHPSSPSCPSTPASSSTSISSWSFNNKKSTSRRSSFSSSTTSIALLDRIPLFPNSTLRPPQEGLTCRIKDTFENRTAWPTFFAEPYTTTPYASRFNSPFDENGDEEESIYAGIYRGVGKKGSTTSLASLRSVASVKGGGSANAPLFGVGGKRLKKKSSSSSLVDEVHPSTLSVVRGLTRPERTAKPKGFASRTAVVNPKPPSPSPTTPRTLVKPPVSTNGAGTGLNNAPGVAPRAQSANATTSLMNRWSFAGTTKTGSVPSSIALPRNEPANRKEASSPATPTNTTPRPSPTLIHRQTSSPSVPSPMPITSSTSVGASAGFGSSQPPSSTRASTVTSRGRQTSTSSSSSSGSSDIVPPTIVSATISSRRLVSSSTPKNKRFSVEGSGWGWTGRFGSSGGGDGGGSNSGSNEGGRSQALVYSDTTSWSVSSRSASKMNILVQQSKTTSISPSPSSRSEPHSSLRASISAVSLSASSNQSHSYSHSSHPVSTMNTSARSLKPTASSSSSQSTDSLVAKPTKSSGYSFASRSTTSLASISLNTFNKAASASSTSLVSKTGASKFGRGLKNLVGGLYSNAPSAFRL
ncbi:hypothetical protein FRC16_000150, partial [Serendipita sp. 398]